MGRQTPVDHKQGEHKLGRLTVIQMTTNETHTTTTEHARNTEWHRANTCSHSNTLNLSMVVDYSVSM